MAKTVRVAMAFVVIVTLGACSAQSLPEVTATSQALAGLPRDVVTERLADPVLEQSLKDAAESDRVEMAQLNISSTIFCRETLSAYETWVTTGVTPGVPAVARPDMPAAGFDSFMNAWHQDVQTAIASGDPEVLRSWLLLLGGCHDTVAAPATDTTQTVADVLQGR